MASVANLPPKSYSDMSLRKLIDLLKARLEAKEEAANRAIVLAQPIMVGKREEGRMFSDVGPNCCDGARGGGYPFVLAVIGCPICTHTEEEEKRRMLLLHHCDNLQVVDQWRASGCVEHGENAHTILALILQPSNAKAREASILLPAGSQ